MTPQHDAQNGAGPARQRPRRRSLVLRNADGIVKVAWSLGSVDMRRQHSPQPRRSEFFRFCVDNRIVTRALKAKRVARLISLALNPHDAPWVTHNSGARAPKSLSFLWSMIEKVVRTPHA